ncbi:MAG: DcaP family trimeric outer membrane transporter [Rhizobacter sp.]
MHQPTPRRRAVHIAVASALAASAASAKADDMEDLRSQVDTLLRKVSDLDRRQAAAIPTTGLVTGGATKGSFRLPGSDTSVTLGGYVKLDAIYSDKSAGVASSADQEYEAGAVPVGPAAGANERGQVKLHARQSRFFIKTASPSALGDVGTYLEFDLFGAAGNETVSNSHGLRVRHAYGTLGGLLAGQTWTTFSDPATYPDTLDFGGPAGVIFARQAQVRWTQKFGAGQWSVALENPESIVSLHDGTAFRADDDRLPDIAGNVHLDTAWGKFSLAALARQVRVDSASAPASRDQRWGGGLGLNGVMPFGAKDDARFSVYYGNGLGRYTVGFFTDGILDANQHLQLANQWVAMAAYRHYWNEGLRSTLALSALRAGNPDGTAGSVNRGAESAHLNLIWSPVVQANLGLELLVARRETQDGLSGTLHRVQASAQYLF